MSVTKTFSSVALDSVLEQIEVQLDGTTSIVKIPSGTFNFLDAEGQAAAKRQASLVLGHQAEFYLDSRCDNRVYLASLANIKIHHACEARMIPGFHVPVLFPTAPPKKTKSPNGFLVYRTHHSLALKAEIPGITTGEISTILGARWKALTAEEKEPWLQSARAKAEAKHAEESVSDPSSARGTKRRRIDYATPQSLDENDGVSQYARNHYTQASQPSRSFDGYQFQSPASEVPSYTPSNLSFNSSNYATPESLPQSKTVDEQHPPNSWTGSLSENPVQSLAYNETAKTEKSQNTAEEYERDADGIFTADALYKYMQDADIELYSLELPLAN
ncbi:hypothetical protein FHL15_003526 [Xylaria flabelliformis]|uniref:HMG box domain-containing protein n=1 Tax=Xylaria flabelliformis TaxID=2512241 RepID=A0A553I5T4_9PEZI|nr:hypothetical protein FHL15_003526 [Xylaria flabelliformis]